MTRSRHHRFAVVLLFAGCVCAPAAGAEPLTLKGHTGWIGGVAFSPDGKTLATASADKSVKLWDAASGKELATLNGHTDYVSSVAFSPDGKSLASGSYDHTAKLWDVEKRIETAALKMHQGAVMTVAFEPNREWLHTGGIDGYIHFWSKIDGRYAGHVTDHLSWVNAIAFSPDGHCVASVSSDATAILRREKPDLDLTIRPKAGELRSLAFSPDSKSFAIGTRYGLVKVFDAATGKELATLKGHAGDVWAVAFSHDGKTLASGDGDWNRPGDIRLWDTATWKETGKLQHTGEVLCLAFSPKKNVLAAGSWDRTVKLWNLDAK